jgi:hypothetical protein
MSKKKDRRTEALRKALELLTEVTTPDKLDKSQLARYYELEGCLQNLEADD